MPKDRPEGDRDSIRFLLNGELIEVDDVQPTETVLHYLRERRRLTGTKEGCAEGDCGACTVVVGKLRGDDLMLEAVNACIQFVPTLDGKAVFTVEYLRAQADGGLHPVQQAMVDHHGSQCGFCTPGFIMSLWNVYNAAAGSSVDEAALRTALSGNLCRCTGYRPILKAGEAMFDFPVVDLDRAALKEQLAVLRRDHMPSFATDGAAFHAPRTLAELTERRAELPEAIILAGCTDIGLWVTKQLRDLGDVIYIGEVDGLDEIREDDGKIRIGAGASLSDAYAALVKHYPEATEMWERFASVPIRNAGTLGGNIANGSPIGDSMPWLIAVGAEVMLRNAKAARTLALEDLYLDYMKKDMAAGRDRRSHPGPVAQAGSGFSYVQTRQALRLRYLRRLCRLQPHDGRSDITDARVAFGGVAATPKRATNCEKSPDRPTLE